MPKTKFQEFLRATSQAGVPQQDHLATAAGVKSCSKLQDLTYGVLMTFFMVIAMELYNAGLRDEGLTYSALPNALSEMRFMFPICFVMGFFFIDRLAPKIAFKMAVPGKDNPLLVTTVRACVTVAFMCPIMSLWATFIFKHPGIHFLPVWLQTVACNFPMALIWQVFYCGPLVRFLFRKIFL